MTDPPVIASKHSQRKAQQKPRHYHFRLVRAYIYDVWALLEEAKVPLIGFVLLTLINVIYLTCFYNHPRCEAVPAGQPGACLDVGRALFETVRMFVFEINLEWPENDFIGKVLFFVTPLAGLALIFQSVLEFGRYLLDKGNRREAWQIALAKTFHQHVIICGLGRVSYRVMIQLLDAGYDVVVIERYWSSEFVPQALKHRVPVVVGDAREPDVQRRAGIMRARGLIAGTNDDLLNIEMVLTARRQSDTIQVVMRIFSDDLDSNLEHNFGPNTAFSSSALGAPTLAVAALSCNIAYVLPLADVVLGISEITIAPNSQLTGFGSHIEARYNLRLLQWLGRDKTWQWPKPGLRLEGGDVVLLMGTIDALEQAHLENERSSKFDFLQPEQPERPTPQRNKVIVCGLGKVGYRVVKELHRRKPCPEITVICGDNTAAPFVKELQAAGIHIVRGDARVPEMLYQADIEHAYSIAAVTSDNLANIQIGLNARRIRPDIDVVLRVFSSVLAEQLDTIFGPYTAFSTSALAAPTLAAAAVEPGTSYALNIGDRLLSTIEIPVQADDEFAGKTVEQVYAERKALVLALRRYGERALMPNPQLALQPGDEIEIMSDIRFLSELRPRAASIGHTTTRRLLASRRTTPLSEQATTEPSSSPQTHNAPQ
jgi:Trk K+ transport system NAD-binding subunit